MNITKINILHPFLFAIFPIISTYSSNLQELLPNYLIQPVVIMLVFTTIIFLIAKLVFKNWSKASIMVSIIIGLIFSYGYIYLQIGGVTVGDFVIGRHVFLIVPYIITFLGTSFYIFRTKHKLKNITKILNVVAITLILVSIISISTYAINNNGLGIVVLENAKVIDEIDPIMDNQDKKMISQISDLEYYPDVYFLILDGYGGATSLKNDLGFDNSKFIQMLEEKGFFVASKSHSNYPMTFLSIPSTMNMNYLNYLKDDLGEESKDQITPIKMLKEPIVIDIFKSKGYKIVTFQNSNFDVNSDYVECQSNSLIEANKLMSTISKINIFSYVLEVIETEHIREDQKCFFSELPQIHNKLEDPIFVFAHIMLPHPPNVFGPNGEYLPPRIYYNEWGTDEDKQRYLDTLQYGNLRVEEFIDNVLKDTDHQPIIIIESDHGTDFGFNWDNPTNGMLKQRFSNLNAFYMPKGKDLLYDSITPINSFRIMFNSNFNGTFELLEDKSYFSSYEKPYKFQDITKILEEK